GKLYSPTALVTVSRGTLVASLVTVTVTPGITPLASLTVPRMPPVNCWLKPGVAPPKTTTRMSAAVRNRETVCAMNSLPWPMSRAASSLALMPARCKARKHETTKPRNHEKHLGLEPDLVFVVFVVFVVSWVSWVWWFEGGVSVHRS